MTKFVFSAVVIFLLYGCDTTPRKSFEQQVAEIPAPTTDEEKQKVCKSLRSEIARQNNIAAFMSTGQYAMLARASAADNIAILESRASDFQCNAAFGSSVSAPSPIKACISACKENTSRSPEQCFEACNK
jgi:uncharacterized lipoprotein YajG